VKGAGLNTETFRDLLLAERKRVADAISYLHEENSRSHDDAEEEAFDNHIADAASNTLNREIDTTLEENSEHVLKAIDAALQRIDDGNFGICARCGRPIAEERLEAMPYATKCIECKRLEERG
jgi:RNA polymerase-binding protein DksA